MDQTNGCGQYLDQCRSSSQIRCGVEAARAEEESNPFRFLKILPVMNRTVSLSLPLFSTDLQNTLNSLFAYFWHVVLA